MDSFGISGIIILELRTVFFPFMQWNKIAVRQIGSFMDVIGIIEDDRLLNQALVIALQKEGYQTLSAYDYKEGYQLAKQNPDLFLVDINLPDGDGVALCKAIREYQEIPVIFLTGRDEEEDMLGAFSAGADDYVVKPFQMSVLLKRVQAVLHRCGQHKDTFLYKGLKVIFDQKKVFCDGNEIALTPKEYLCWNL